ncbi:MAG: GIY-YIG nuclease family protein [Leucobacter sp.]
MAYTYILQCADGTYYVGSTTHLQLRLAQHAAGIGAEYTRHRLPVHLAWAQDFESAAEAFAMEKRIQGWAHDKRKLLIEEGPAALRGWSKRRK